MKRYPYIYIYIRPLEVTSFVVVFCRVRAQRFVYWPGWAAIHHRTLPRPPGQLASLFWAFRESDGGWGGTVIVRDCTTVSEGMCLPLGPRNILAANTERVEVGWGNEIKRKGKPTRE